jgi:hypothetical protein
MRQFFDRNRLMALVSPQQSRRTSGSFVGSGWFWSLARFPNRHRALERQLHLGKLRAKTGVGPVTGIRQHNPFGDASLTRSSDLGQGDFCFSMEGNLSRHARFPSPFSVVSPRFWQI